MFKFPTMRSLEILAKQNDTLGRQINDTFSNLLAGRNKTRPLLMPAKMQMIYFGILIDWENFLRGQNFYCRNLLKELKYLQKGILTERSFSSSMVHSKKRS